MSLKLCATILTRLPSVSVIVQNYDTGVGYEDILLGNDVIFKCKVPSFVDDFVHIINWVDNDGVSYYPRIDKGKTVPGCPGNSVSSITNQY